VIEPFDLRNIQREHNIGQVFALCGYGFLSVVLWLVSYMVVFSALCLPDWKFGIQWFTGWESVIAGAVMGVILVVGLRNTRPLFDVGDHSGTLSGQMMGPARMPGGSLRVGSSGAAILYLVTQTFLSAPRTLALAVRAARSFVLMDTDEIVSATKLLNEMGEHREWTPAENYGRADIMEKLVKMEIVWDKEEEGKKVVHVSMSIQAKYFP